MADGHGEVVGGRLHEPTFVPCVGVGREANVRLSVAYGHDFVVCGLGFGDDEFEATARRLRDTERRDGAVLHFRLDRYAAAALSVVEAETAQDGTAFCDGKMERPVMPHKNRAAQVVRSHDFAETAANTKDIAYFHGERGLEVALAGAGDAARRKERMTDDEAALEPFVVVAVRAVVIVGVFAFLTVLK